MRARIFTVLAVATVVFGCFLAVRTPKVSAKCNGCDPYIAFTVYNSNNLGHYTATGSVTIQCYSATSEDTCGGPWVLVVEVLRYNESLYCWQSVGSSCYDFAARNCNQTDIFPGSGAIGDASVEYTYVADASMKVTATLYNGTCAARGAYVDSDTDFWFD